MFSLSPIIILVMLVDEAHARLRLETARLFLGQFGPWALNVIGEDRERRAPPPPPPAPDTLRTGHAPPQPPPPPDAMRVLHDAISAVVPGSRGAQLHGVGGGDLGSVVAIHVYTAEALSGRLLTDAEWEALRSRGLPLIPAVAARRLRMARERGLS